MSSISIKGILIGGLFGLVAAGVSSFLLVQLVLAASGAERPGESLLTSWPVYLAVQGTGIIVSIATGYIAAWIAKRGELINGALSSFGFIALAAYSMMFGVHAQGGWLDITIVTAPLLALLGGYLRKRIARSSGNRIAGAA